MTNTLLQPEYQELSQSISSFGLSCFQQSRPLENLVFSPLSIYIAMGMLHEGAHGATKNELSQLFAHLGEAPVTSTLGNLMHELKQREQITASQKRRVGSSEERKMLVEDGFSEEQIREELGTTTVEDIKLNLEVVNSLWVQDGYPCKDSYMDAIRTEMNSVIRSLDIVGNPISACKEINDWIGKKTRGRIGPLINPDSITEWSRLLLANVVYFKARWQYEFGPTKPDEFKLFDGSRIQVPMMTSGPPKKYVKAREYWAIELPYCEQPISMTIFMPRKHGKKNFIALEKMLPALIECLPITPADRAPSLTLTMPEFKISSLIDVSSHLKIIGINRVFSQEADLTGISDVKPLWVDGIVHGACINVDRYGTEAAAATFGMLIGFAAPEKIIHLVVDRPFLFVIHDKPTQTVLFVGRVIEPA